MIEPTKLGLTMTDKANYEEQLRNTQPGPDRDSIMSYCTGPGTGFVWNSETQTLDLAPGYVELADGTVVLAADYTGPATGMIYNPDTKSFVKVANVRGE